MDKLTIGCVVIGSGFLGVQPVLSQGTMQSEYDGGVLCLGQTYLKMRFSRKHMLHDLLLPPDLFYRWRFGTCRNHQWSFQEKGRNMQRILIAPFTFVNREEEVGKLAPFRSAVPLLPEKRFQQMARRNEVLGRNQV